MNLSIRPMTPAERDYTYTQSHQIMSQTGCIGHLRADFGTEETVSIPAGMTTSRN